MHMEHDGPPDTKPRGSSGYLPGGVSGEKPAPTAAEVAAARQHATWLRDQFTERTRIEDVAVTLLAALDAAEAREKAAYRDGWDANVEASREILTRAETAERERDEARAALKPFAKIEVPVNAHDGTWVAMTLYCGDQVTAHSVWAARAALGLGKEAPRG